MEQDRAYFITATILHWQHLLKDDEHKDIIIDEWRDRVAKKQLQVYGFVIMPNHYHAIISIPAPHDPSDIVRDIHKWTARQLIQKLKADDIARLPSFKVKAADRSYQIWERNSLPILLYSREMLHQKLDYIHNNPLQEHWALVGIPEDYLYSSAKYYLLNDENWDFLTHFNE